MPARNDVVSATPPAVPTDPAGATHVTHVTRATIADVRATPPDAPVAQQAKSRRHERHDRRRREQRRPPMARLKLAGLALLSGAALLLLAGWFMPELWRPAFAEWRATGFALLGAGALLMWQQTRQDEGRLRLEALSSLTHSSLMPYEFAPVTLPMEDPAAEPAAVGANVSAAALAAVDAGPPTGAESSGAMGPSSNSNTLSTAAVDAALHQPITALAPEAPPTVPTPPATPQWTPGLLRTLEWRRFEALCEEIFKQDGYVVKADPHGENGTGAGYLWLHSRLDLQQPVRIVECRNWSGEPVGVAAVREFLGAMVDAGLKSGALMTCGAFTAEAEALARRHGIMAVSGPDLLALVGKRPEALQQELLTVATQGDATRPTCRRCGLKMLAPRTAPATTDGALTRWVCQDAPRCPGTLEWSAGPA